MGPAMASDEDIPPDTSATAGSGGLAEKFVTVVCLVACVSFVAWQLDPPLLLANTTAAGGDTGAHVALPAFLEQLLSTGRLAGWDPAWFAGFPYPTFYFPLSDLTVGALNSVVSYNVAFKLVTVLGSLSLPVAAWALGRMGRLPRPGPEMMAVGAVMFLFDRSFTIDGGNLASTLAGEYDYSLALSLALVFLGVTFVGLRTGRYRALSAVLLGAITLTHIVPLMYAATGAAANVLNAPGRRRFRWAVPVALCGAALPVYWLGPFVAGLPYTTSMGWSKVTDYMTSMAPWSLRPILVAAAVGLVASFAAQRPVGRLIGTLTVFFGAAFMLAPPGQLYNARFLPFWILGTYLLAAVGVAEVVLASVRLARLAGASLGDKWPGLERGGLGRPGRVPAPIARGVAGVLAPLAALTGGLVAVDIPLGTPPWFPIKAAPTSFIPSWVKWNYSGYQRKAAWPEYHAIVKTMASVGRSNGCGRAMWEYGPELNDFGTPMALMLLPYWTHGCIDSMEGLLFESSATTPYHFLNQALLSSQPSEAMAHLPYGSLDVDLGVTHLQQLGVRYYMAFTPQAQAQANADRRLTEIASTGPWPTQVGNRVVERTWRVYKVAHSSLVVPARFQPVVATGGSSGRKGWLAKGLEWYTHPSMQAVEYAARGPGNWARVGWQNLRPPLRPEPATVVSGISETSQSLRFRVTTTGVPVVVKISYFPNWRVSGASGPWRVAPNLMVVVPTSHSVTLRYGMTGTDIASAGISIAALAATTALGVGDRRRRFRAEAGSPEEGAGPARATDVAARQ